MLEKKNRKPPSVRHRRNKNTVRCGLIQKIGFGEIDNRRGVPRLQALGTKNRRRTKRLSFTNERTLRVELDVRNTAFALGQCFI
uniref:Uncharacterized protein n=1 Tax=viral metagenome TaxID=1070528 RepID=A0A6C0K9B1_9ZZZZ